MTRVAGSLLASKPGLVAAALAVMCAAMFARAIAWHAILAAAPTWRRASRRDAMQGTFIGVLMSATLPARMGEPSRALIVARRIGRARETLPVVLGTMVSQTLLNLLALALLAAAMLSSADFGELERHGRLILFARPRPLGGGAVRRGAAVAGSRSAAATRGRMRLLRAARAALAGAPGRRRARDLASPRRRPGPRSLQLAAWALQLLACWLLLYAFGLQSGAGVGAAAAVLFAVNVTAALPATPANVGVFQAACVAVLAGAYHVSTPEAIAFAIVLQLIELADRADHGPAGARQRGPLLAGGAPAHQPRHAGPAGAAAAQRRPRSPTRPSPRAATAPDRDEERPCVYLLRCSDGSLYTGWTTRIEHRLERHRAGKASRYTASRLPVELAAVLPMADRRKPAARRPGSSGSTGPPSSA